MSNGHPCVPCCCAIEVCCLTAEAKGKAVAQMMREAHDKANGKAASFEDGTDVFDAMAAELLHHFDMVPAGVGSAIVKGYAPYFEEKQAKKAKGVSEE